MKTFSLVSFILLSLSGAIAATPLTAQEASFTSHGARASLVELYTSEGCSSCPPAEAVLSRLTGDSRLWKELFPVAFHVDYWDGLGWPDRFAKPQYTERQRDYAARLHQDSVYTPEFVVDGAEDRGFFHGQALRDAAADKRGELTLTLAYGRLSGTYVPPGGEDASGLTLNAAVLGVHLMSDVQRGENGGRTLQHDFVALGFVSVPLRAGRPGTLKIDPVALASTTGDAPAALVGWVSIRAGAILQVAGGPLAPAPVAAD